MGILRNFTHAIIIWAAFVSIAIFFDFIELDAFFDTTFSGIGLLVAFLLTFMETTYNRL